MHTIIITVEGGCVVEVENLPEGCDYLIHDLDTGMDTEGEESCS